MGIPNDWYGLVGCDSERAQARDDFRLDPANVSRAGTEGGKKPQALAGWGSFFDAVGRGDGHTTPLKLGSDWTPSQSSNRGASGLNLNGQNSGPAMDTPVAGPACVPCPHVQGLHPMNE